MFAVSTASSVGRCLSAAGLTSSAIVKGASLPSAEPFGPPGDAGWQMPPLAEKPGVWSPDAPSQTGAVTLPTTLSGPISETSLSPSASNAEGALPVAESIVPPGVAGGLTSPSVKRPRVLSPDAPWPTRSATYPFTLSEPISKTPTSPGELLRPAGRPREESNAEGAPPLAKLIVPLGDAGGLTPPLVKRPRVQSPDALLPIYVDVVGTQPRDVGVPQRVDPAGREAKGSF